VKIQEKFCNDNYSLYNTRLSIIVYYKHMKYLLLLSVFFSCIYLNLILNINTAVCAAEESEYVIVLQNRHFVPERGIDSHLKEKLAVSNTFPLYGIVQLKQRPTTEDRVTLSNAGIQLMQYLGGTTYLAGFTKDVRLDAVSYILRWAGPLLPQDKMEKALWEGKIEDWAITENGNIMVLVYFYKNVKPADAESVVSRYADIFKPHGPSNAWAIEISRESIVKLADEEIVKWLEQGPLPFMPLLN